MGQEQKMEQESETTQRKTKDSVFVSLFGDKKYILQLYRELYPEDNEATEEDISVNSLTSVFVNALYNDLAFSVRDQLIFFVEAQSVWDKNITLRLLLYIAETYKRYLYDTGQDLHGNANLKIPKPAVYLVYTGDKKSVPDMVSLSADFFDGDPSVDVQTKVLYRESTETIHGQYIGFCKVFNEQRKIHGNSKECIKETIRICLEKGYLTGYILSHESEVYNVLDILHDEKRSRELYWKRVRKEAEEEGIKKGKAEGIAEGIEEERARMKSVLKAKGFSDEDIADILKLN